MLYAFAAKSDKYKNISSPALTSGAFLRLAFGHGVAGMRYEYSSKELYDSYDNAETLILKAHQRKLLQDRADRGNIEAKNFIRLIEAKESTHAIDTM